MSDAFPIPDFVKDLPDAPTPTPEPEPVPSFEEKLPTVAHARNTDPGTSHAAAASLVPEELREKQRAVLDCYRTFGPMHHEALYDVYSREHVSRKWSHQSISGVRSRSNELARAGYVRDTGRTVRLVSGRASIVWEAVG